MTDFDIVVLGGGSGSQVATAAADEGLEAAVVEPGPLGGACITRGCVPSKALIHRADVVDEIRRAERFGIDAELTHVDFSAITTAIHDTVYEKAERQERTLEDADGVTLYRGRGRFVDDHTIAIDAADGDDDDDSGERTRITGETIVIATGSRPVVPPVDGLEEVGYLTSDDALFLEEQPDELVIVGGGYIAAELGYCFSALGTDVSIVGRSEQLLPREDGDVSEAVTRALTAREGLEVYTDHEATAVSNGEGDATGKITVTVTVNETDAADETFDLRTDEVLLATGRRPNTDRLGLENTAVELDDHGYVETDGFLKTSAGNVWALGDVLGEQPFKHTADYEARCVAVNILEDTQRTVDYSSMPHAVFTSPQVASVGKTEAELRADDVEYEAVRVTYDAAPLGLILEEPESFVKVLAAPDGSVLGCHIVGTQASTMLHEVVVACQRGSGTVADVAETVHIHPALNEAVLTAFDEAASRRYSTAPDWRGTSE